MTGSNLPLISHIILILVCKSVQDFPTFKHDPNCLLQTAVSRHEGTNSSKNSSTSKFQDLQDHHLASAHSSGIVVKHLLRMPYLRRKDEFPSWRLTCVEIVVFDNSGDLITVYREEVVNWGIRKNVTIFLALSPTSVRVLVRSIFFRQLYTLRIAIFLIKIGEFFVQGTLLAPIPGFHFSQEYPPRGKSVFPSAHELTNLRSLFNYNQKMYRLPLNIGWIRNLYRGDCEIQRNFISVNSPCFAAYGPLLVVSRKLNFTFSPQR